MKTTLLVILIIGVFLYSAGIKVKLKPFAISFDTPGYALGFFFLLLLQSIIFSMNDRDSYLRGYGEGWEDCRKCVIELLEENRKEDKN